MCLDTTKVHLRLRALRPPHRSSSPSLLKAYKHSDTVTTHQINMWQATDHAMVFCMFFLHWISIISLFLYPGTKSLFP